MITKQQIIESLQSMPDKFTIDEIIDRLSLLDKIAIGIEQARNGQTLSEEEVDKRLTNLWR